MVEYGNGKGRLKSVWWVPIKPIKRDPTKLALFG